jgi:hypothetical protein
LNAQSTLNFVAPSASASVNRRSLAQQRRRARERAEREQQQNQPAQAHAHAQVQQCPMEIELYANPQVPAPADAGMQAERGENGPHRPMPLVVDQHVVPAAVPGLARQPYTEPQSRHDLGSMNIVCRHCEALHWMNERLTSSSKSNPQFGTCCDKGLVRLPMLRDPPQYLRHLFETVTPEALDFRSNIRQYNAALAFTSLGVHIDHEINSGRGPYVFRIHGELCHRIGHLIPSEGQRAVYAQLYIYDPHVALDERMQRNENLSRRTMERLQTLLLNNHRYATIFRHAHEILSQHPDDSPLTIHLLADPTRDHRRYNLPSAREIAAVIPGDGTEATSSRDIILHRREGPLQRISDGHRSYECLHYVVFFPHGEDGWHYELRMHQPDKPKPNRVTQIRYGAFRLFPRHNEFSVILRGGTLFQQWVVDVFARADQSRLTYLRTHQPHLRASLYSGLEDAVLAAGDNDLNLHDLGQRVVLPSSYTGGPRYMYQCYQDGLALARYFKKIDIFMTVTCNPKWPEIEREVLPGQTAADRPDLVARVFHMKKQAILDHVYKKGVFGRTVAYIYTIEFQKRGLPHMHILIFLDQPHKLLTPADIDTAIWARWPDPDMHPLLFETVKTCMVHGPCGTFNPNAPCMDNGRCTKGYPKSFQAQTSTDHDGYPRYCRPDDNRTFKVGQHDLDNRWIVPYNPFMSATFNCHINVECAVSFGSVKYVNKYICKGHDRASMTVNSRDEIRQFIDGRYLSPPESVWRILQFHIHEQSPSITRLQVHLPGQHLVTFDPNEDPQAVLERAASEETTLTAFFKANRDHHLRVEAQKYTYQEFPQYFTWKSSTKSWDLRKKGFTLGRMYHVSPTAGERFYLRTLLTVVKGPTSFEDLRTCNGIVHPSFRDACLARGLLENDGEWRQCLQEASAMQTGPQLRRLFVTLLLFCSPANPGALWNEFRQHICDDLQHQLITVLHYEHPTDEDIYDYGLYLLDEILRQSGNSLHDFNIPVPHQAWGERAANRLIANHLSYNRHVEHQEELTQVPLLNNEQREAYLRIVDSVKHERGTVFFLNGPGGTGKTFVYKAVCHHVRAEGWIVLCVASSGIAALLLRGGRTAHSMFKIPIDSLNEDSLCNIPKEGALAGLICVTRLIIWDEIATQHRHAAEAVDRTCRDIRGRDVPFGGITVVIGGDFLQTLPVVVKGYYCLVL